MGRRAAGYWRWFRQLLACSGLLALMAACAPIYQNHGYVPTEEDLALLTVGTDTQDTVASTVGRPSAQTLLSEEGWYYVQSRFRTVGPRQPQEIDRQVVAITFDEAGVLANIERFGLEDGRVVTLSRRVTDTTMGRTSLIAELFKNFGRIRAGDYIN